MNRQVYSGRYSTVKGTVSEKKIVDTVYKSVHGAAEKRSEATKVKVKILMEINSLRIITCKNLFMI